MVTITTPLLSFRVMSTPDRSTSPLSSLSMSSATLPLIDPTSCLLGPWLGDVVSVTGGANGSGAIIGDRERMAIGFVVGFTLGFTFCASVG